MFNLFLIVGMLSLFFVPNKTIVLLNSPDSTIYIDADRVGLYTLYYYDAKDIIMKSQLPPHEHNWQEATCDTPKTCKDCGKTEGRR